MIEVLEDWVILTPKVKDMVPRRPPTVVCLPLKQLYGIVLWKNPDGSYTWRLSIGESAASMIDIEDQDAELFLVQLMARCEGTGTLDDDPEATVGELVHRRMLEMVDTIASREGE